MPLEQLHYPWFTTNDLLNLFFRPSLATQPCHELWLSHLFLLDGGGQQKALDDLKHSCLSVCFSLCRFIFNVSINRRFSWGGNRIGEGFSFWGDLSGEYFREG